MRICVTAQDGNLESKVDPRFGRCTYFIFVDADTMEFDAVKNDQAQAMGGAGVQAGQSVVDNNAEVLLTGNIGPNAYRTLEAGNVEIITGVEGTVREAIERYKREELESSGGPSVDTHFGVRKEE
jgi:predicted Fe-Mo cluster-binding NifX family protein